MTTTRARYELSAAMQAFVETSNSLMEGASSLIERREAFRRACRHFTPAAPEGTAVEDRDINGLRLRIHLPQGQAPEQGWLTLLYFHGGGWDLGGLDTHDWFAFALLRRLPMAVVTVDYRLAPEYPFPAPLEDGLAALRAVRAGRVHERLSRNRVGVCGDSAGGTLAAGLCHAVRDSGNDQPDVQVLVYPVLTTRDNLPSMREHAEAPLMTVEGLSRSLAGFLPQEQDRHNPQAMPLEAVSFSGLAPAVIYVAELDPLHDQGTAYRDALEAAGVRTQCFSGQGLVHSSLRGQGIEAVEHAYDVIAASIASLFLEDN